MVSRFMSNPKEIHWKEAKKILRYPHGTIGYGLVSRYTEYFRLIGYTYSYGARCMDDRKSTSGCSFNMGSPRVVWITKKKSIVSLCTVEAEYKEVTTIACEEVWLRIILQDIHEKKEKPT